MIKWPIIIVISFLPVSFNGQEWNMLVENNQFASSYFTQFESLNDDILVLGYWNVNGNDEQYAGFVLSDSDVAPFGPVTENGRGYCFVAELSGISFLGGSFKNYFGLDAADKIAGISGDTWFSLGQGICLNTATVLDLEIFQNKLVACGSISEIDCNDEIQWMQFGMWDGNQWSTMGGVWGGIEPRKLIHYDNKLFVLGRFESVSLDNSFENSINTQNIAYFDGNAWGEPLNGVNGNLYDAYVDQENNILYVGGFCTLASGIPVANVAAWDGSNWHSVGDNLTGDIYALEMYQGQLYAGGVHVLSEEGTLAYFDGVNWQPVPGQPYNIGSPAYIRDLKVHDGELLAGGEFDYSGSNLNVQGLAKYYLDPDSVHWGIPDYIETLSENIKAVYPNPADDIVTVEFKEVAQHLVIVTDCLGREVMRSSIVNSNLLAIDTSSLGVGNYILSVIEMNSVVSFSKISIR
jgi:hypothetical protein